MFVTLKCDTKECGLSWCKHCISIVFWSLLHCPAGAAVMRVQRALALLWSLGQCWKKISFNNSYICIHDMKKSMLIYY